MVSSNRASPTSVAGRRATGSVGRSSNAPTARSAQRYFARPSIAWLLTLSALLSLAGLAMIVITVMPELQLEHQWVTLAASFAPYGWFAWLGAVIAAATGARGRTRMVLAPLLLGLVWDSSLVAGYLLTPPAPASGRQLRILTLNEHFGQASPTEIANLVSSTRPDLVVLLEITRSNQKALLKRKSWRKAMPHRIGRAGQDFRPAAGVRDGSGTVVFSRFPITDLKSGRDRSISTVVIRVALEDQPVTVIAAHPVNPQRSLARWQYDYASLTRTALEVAGGPMVIVGDLNATAEHLPLRELKARLNLTDSVAGFGWQPTFPADSWHPPLIQIDHILVSREFTASTYQTARVSGTDHLGALATLKLSR